MARLDELLEIGVVMKAGGNIDERLSRIMFEQTGGPDGGSVTLLRPDGTPYPGRPSLVAVSPVPGPRRSMATTMSGFPTSPARKARSWNFAASRTEPARLVSKPAIRSHRPAVMSAGICRCRRICDQPGRRCVGDEQLAGHRQLLRCASEPLSTRCGGQGVTIFFGMAKPVRSPQIGPARALGEQ